VFRSGQILRSEIASNIGGWAQVGAVARQPARGAGGVAGMVAGETRDNPVFSPKKQDGRFARRGSGNPIVVTRTHILIFTHP
jgi:hypothetical protein